MNKGSASRWHPFTSKKKTARSYPGSCSNLEPLRYTNRFPAFFASKLIILVTLLICVTCTYANSPAPDSFSHLELSPDKQKYALPLHMWTLETSRDTELNEIRHSSLADDFRPNRVAIPNHGFSHSAFWYRTTIESTFSQETHWILEIDDPMLNHIEVYAVHPDGSITGYKGGSLLPFEDRPIRSSSHAFPIQVDASSRVKLYVKVWSNMAIFVPMTLWEPQAFNEESRFASMVNALYLGLMIAMLFYNSFVYISLRDKSYLYYLFFLSSSILNATALSGLLAEFVLPGSPHLVNILFSMSYGLWLIFAILFSMTFLGIDSRHRFFYLTGKIMISIGSVTVVLSAIWYYSQTLLVVAATSVPASLLLVIIGIWGVIKGKYSARYYLMAWIVFIIGTILFSLTCAGLLPKNSITFNSLQIGAAIEAILLSVALASRMRTMRAAVEEAQKEALENQQRALDNLRRMDKLKDEFMANMSHELRTPMNAIIGYSEILIEETEEEGNSHYHSDLNKILKSSRHLLGLIDNVLDLSKIEAGKMEVHFESVDINALIEEVKAIVEPLARKHNNQLDVEIPKEHLTLYTDATKLRQVLFNLLSNAAKFTEKGSLLIRVSTQTGKECNWVIFEVKDSGIGMSQEQLDKVFDAFTQADTSTTRKYGGTGLGLTISRHYCEMLGGRLDASSAPG
ncbi:MAG: sensor histidine kinase, partial [Ketobacteraceae bacterium]|nr:sensor histidine kinase [Ketobacteraceae bacterium]